MDGEHNLDVCRKGSHVGSVPPESRTRPVYTRSVRLIY